MDLRGILARSALRRAHVLMVEVPGWAGVRMALEQELEARGWPPALTPADADILCICGTPGDEFSSVLEKVWEQLPGPRARIVVLTASDIPAALARAAADLVDGNRQRLDARRRSADAAGPAAGHAGHGHTAGHARHGHAAGSAGQDSAEQMDHGGMDMPMPEGIPLAGEGDDRDGLRLDVLHVPLGPVLPCWPAGLVLRCALQGDVVTEAHAEILAPAATGPDLSTDALDPNRAAAVRHCDSAARLLALSGWEDAAASAQRIRNALLDGSNPERCAAELGKLARRVRRSRMLRWSLHGLGIVGPPRVEPSRVRPPRVEPPRVEPPRTAGSSGPETGTSDVLSRLLGFLAAGQHAADDAGPATHRPTTTFDSGTIEVLDLVCALVRGQDLGVARLIVASLAPDTAAMLAAGAGRGAGQ